MPIKWSSEQKMERYINQNTDRLKNIEFWICTNIYNKYEVISINEIINQSYNRVLISFDNIEDNCGNLYGTFSNNEKKEKWLATQLTYLSIISKFYIEVCRERKLINCRICKNEYNILKKLFIQLENNFKGKFVLTYDNESLTYSYQSIKKPRYTKKYWYELFK